MFGVSYILTSRARRSSISHLRHESQKQTWWTGGRSNQLFVSISRQTCPFPPFPRNQSWWRKALLTFPSFHPSPPTKNVKNKKRKEHENKTVIYKITLPGRAIQVGEGTWWKLKKWYRQGCRETGEEGSRRPSVFYASATVDSEVRAEDGRRMNVKKRRKIKR